VYVLSSELGISQVPTPLAPASVPLPPKPGGGSHSPAGEGLGESQFRRLEKSLALCLLCGVGPGLDRIALINHPVCRGLDSGSSIYLCQNSSFWEVLHFLLKGDPSMTFPFFRFRSAYSIILVHTVKFAFDENFETEVQRDGLDTLYILQKSTSVPHTYVDLSSQILRKKVFHFKIGFLLYTN
jgi:hypothetical protein